MCLIITILCVGAYGGFLQESMKLLRETAQKHTSLGNIPSFIYHTGDPLKWYHRFYSIAHEIAHNVVPSHNSTHVHYFTLICEMYHARFSQLLLAVSGSTQWETVA